MPHSALTLAGAEAPSGSRARSSAAAARDRVGAFDTGQAAKQRGGEVVRQCLRVVGGVPGQVVAEVVVAGGDGIDLAGQVPVAQRVTLQVDGVLPVPGLILNVGERGQNRAEVLRVVLTLENLAAVQQQRAGLGDAPEPQQRIVVVEPVPGHFEGRCAAVFLGFQELGVERERVFPAS